MFHARDCDIPLVRIGEHIVNLNHIVRICTPHQAHMVVFLTTGPPLTLGSDEAAEMIGLLAHVNPYLLNTPHHAEIN